MIDKTEYSMFNSAIVNDLHEAIYEGLEKGEHDATINAYNAFSRMCNKGIKLNHDRAIEAAFKGFEKTVDENIILLLYLRLDISIKQIIKKIISTRNKPMYNKLFDVVYYLSSDLSFNDKLQLAYEMNDLKQIEKLIIHKEDYIISLFGIIDPNRRRLINAIFKVKRNRFLIRFSSLIKNNRTLLQTIIIHNISDGLTGKDMAVVLNHISFDGLIRDLYKNDYNAILNVILNTILNTIYGYTRSFRIR